MHREGSKIELFSITMGKFNVGEKIIKFIWKIYTHDKKKSQTAITQN